MTQAVSNSLNNLQELMTQANQLQNKVTEVNGVLAVDKTSDKLVDFSKVYEKQILKEKNNINTANNNRNINNTDNKINDIDVIVKDNNLSDVKTIADLKNNGSVLQSEIDWADFQAILSEITEESNAEISLDLTLARDIEEIISQLKSAVNETVDETEDVVEQTDVVEETVAQVVDEKINLNEVQVQDKEISDIDISEELLINVNNSFSKEFDNIGDVFQENQATEFNSLENSFETLEMFTELSTE